jgi:hypothetical protein
MNMAASQLRNINKYSTTIEWILYNSEHASAPPILPLLFLTAEQQQHRVTSSAS